jgi:hypothetical protein
VNFGTTTAGLGRTNVPCRVSPLQFGALNVIFAVT